MVKPQSQLRRSLQAVVAGALVFSGLQVLTPLAGHAAAPGSTVRGSLDPNGSTIPGGVDDFNAISGDGNVVAFVTTAGLLTTDTNGLPDLYRRNLTTGAVDLVTVDTSGLAAGGIPPGTYDFDLNQDGTAIAFESTGDNLVSGDVDGRRDIFVRGPNSDGIQTTRRADVNDDGSTPTTFVSSNSNAYRLSLSADGTRVAFAALWSLVAQGDPSGAAGAPGVYIRDLGTGHTERVSSGNTAGSTIAISGDGSSVAFLDTTVGEYALRLFHGGSTTAVNAAPGGYAPIAFIGGHDAVNVDGTAVAFTSEQPDLVAGDTNGSADGFVYRVGAATPVSRVTVADDESEATSGGFAYAISDDGTKVAFSSTSDNLSPGAIGFQCYVRDSAVGTGTTTIVSVDSAGAVSNSTSYNPDLSRDGSVVSFTSYATNLDSTDTNNARDVYVHTLANPVTPANVFLQIQGADGTYSTLPGASDVAAADIPASALPLGALSEVAGTPLRSVDIASSPLRSVPLRSVPLRSVPLRSVPLRSVTLSDIPLRSVGLSWPAILATLNPNPFVGVPLQAITLDQVLDAFDAQPSATGLNSVALGDLDLSATPLRSVTMASLALGATPLRSVPIVGSGGTVPTGDAVFAAWCTTLAGLGYSCADLGLTQDSPLLALDLEGVPLRSVPLRSVPLRSVTFPPSAPLRSVPLRSVQLAGIPLGGLLISQIDATKRPTIVDCAVMGPNCNNETLADAANAGAIVASATLGMLLDAVAAADLPGSLLDLLQGLINVADYPWQDLPLDDVGIADFQQRGPTLTYQLDFDLTGAGDAATTAVVTLPHGFRYVLGSGEDVFEERPLANPVITPGTATTGPVLTWQLTTTGGDSKELTFDVRPGLDLGNYTSSAVVTVNGVSASDTKAAPVRVIEGGEGGGIIPGCEFDCVAPGNNVPPGTDIVGNTLYISHLATAGDVDYYHLSVPPKGTRIQVMLGVPDGADFDVAMLNGSQSAPLRSVPLRSVPLRSVPLSDQGLGVDASSTNLTPETLQDIPESGLPLRNISENRSSASEVINTTSDADLSSGTGYTLQVSGYNGSSSDQPYVLYVKEYEPPAPPTCTARSFANNGQGVPGVAPATLGTDRNTLFLVSPKRLGDTYGKTAADDVMSKLGTLAGRSDVKGLVYPVEGKSSAASALATWDAAPCDPDKANAAFSAISTIVDDVRASNPDLKSVVVVGSDDLIPMARVADYTQISNESDYAASTLKGDGTGTPIAAAEASQNILTDDPLGVSHPIAWLDHQLYVPEIAVGRLVESPADIVGQIEQYIASNGKLDPKTSLSTGYDFLADGAQAVDAAFGARLAAGSRKTLINETWSRSDLNAALFPSTGSPDLAAVNGHYDHNRALPALGNSTNDESDLFNVGDVTAHPQALINRILFSMGCHAGLNLPDAYLETGSSTAKDWAQTYAGQRAAIYLANTGFGYGDTAAVALSEQLMSLFAQRLDGSMTVGEAAAFAKQAYFGQLGAYGPYDEKAMQEATFYGLPMYTIGTATAPTGVTKVTPAAGSGGVASYPVSVSPTFTSKTSAGGGTYYTVGGESQVTQYRPIVPRTSVPVTPSTSGLVAHGFLTTALASHDVATVPAIARPVIDLTANEQPPTSGEVAFPTTFSNLTQFATPTGVEQRLVLLPGQVFRDESWQGSGAVERLFDTITGEVKYSSSEDYTQPFLTDAEASLSGGVLTLSLDASDASGIATVLVLVKDESGLWRSVTLTLNTTSGQYEGTLAGIQGTNIEYFAQAQDNAGNVGITTNKGRYFGALLPAGSDGAQPVPPVLRTDPGQPNGFGGYYRTGVSVVVTGPSSYTVSVDGGSPRAYTGPVPISGDGTRLVRAAGSDGTSALLVVPIDATSPTVTIAGVTAGGQYVKAPTPTCVASDATSGIASCTVIVTGGDATHTKGTLTATATAFDRAGNKTSRSVTYTAGYSFGGFQQPINDTGHTITSSTSVFKAGSTVPVRFQILDPAGKPVALATAPVWISPVRSGALSSQPNEATVNVASSSGTVITFDNGTMTYFYNWKTDKRDGGYWYKIGIQLADGTVFWTYIGLS